MEKNAKLSLFEQLLLSKKHFEGQKTRFKSFFKYFSLFLVLSLFPLSLMAYGYGVNDPLIKAFRNVGKNLSRNNWSGIGRDIENLKELLQELHAFNAEDLEKIFAKAIEKKNRQLLSETYLKLTVESSLKNLWWNLHEKIEDRQKSRPRVNAVDRYLKDILALPIANRKGTETRKRVARIIGDLRQSLGNPGAFGLGKVEKKPLRFFDLSLEFHLSLWEIFPESAPKWLPKINRKNASKNFSDSLKSAEKAKSFIERRQQILRAMTCFSFIPNEKIKEEFFLLFSLAGKPGETPEKFPAKKFSQKIRTILKLWNETFSSGK
jgi:hypothetical protein